jgi:hypothetical protein
VAYAGALAFGLVIGWVTYRTLRRRSGRAKITDVATVIGAVAGAGVTAIFDKPTLFGYYGVGLAIGFFGYLAVAMKVLGAKAVVGVDGFMGDFDRPAQAPAAPVAHRREPEPGFMGDAERTATPERSAPEKR